MSVSTYAELKTAVANHLNRSDLTSRIPEFIVSAEGRIGRELRIRQMEKRATASISTEYADMPTDFIEQRNIQINGTTQDRLQYLSPEQMDKFHSSQSTGTPTVYTIIGTEFQFKPVPDTSYTVEIAYFARFAAMSADNDTNWLLTNEPDTYVYASLIAAAPYLDEDPRLQTWAALYSEIVKTLNDQDKKARYSGATLRMRPDVGDITWR